jgi:hypothetical protein
MPARTTHLARMDDPQLAAFRRLLADAHLGGQSKVDALVALSQRTVHVVPWPGGIEGWRTLVNREGVAALPLFSSFEELEEAARRYGWLDSNAAAPFAEVGARAALNYAVREKLSFVVIDIAAEHALEIAREEFEPLLTPAARRDSSGPYAGAGRVSSSLIRAVRPTGSTPAASPAKAGGGLESVAASESLSSTPGFVPSVSAAALSGAGVSIAPLASEPPDALLDALAAVLRNYPEVEWACFCIAVRAASAPASAVGVRIDASYRQRVGEIAQSVRRAGEQRGAALDVLLLDDATVMRNARGQGVVFYPWRKK